MNTALDTIIKEAYHEWIAALDVVEYPIFMHDRDFRILRCNRAYQQQAGLPFQEIIGRPYFEVFPKRDAPLPHCLHTVQNPAEEGADEEILVGKTLFRSRAFVTRDYLGEYLYSIHILEDITLAKHNETKLREHEEFIKAVLDNLPIGIAVNTVTPEVAFTYMNDNFPRLYRTTRESLSTPESFWEAVYEDRAFREAIKKRVMEDYASGDPEKMKWFDIPITRKGEGTRFVSARNVPMPGGESVISMVWDVTERKRAEEALEESERKFRAIFDNARDGILLADTTTKKFVMGNARICRMLGYRAEELTSLGVDDIHPEDALPFVLEQFAKQVQGEIELAADLPVKRQDGSLFFADVNAFPIVFSNKTYLAGFFHDVTERHEAQQALLESEERYKRIISELMDYHYTVRVENGHAAQTRQSPTCVTVTGYEAEEFYANPDLWLEMVVPDDRELVVRRVNQVLEGRDVPPIEHRILRKDGTLRWVSDTIIPFRDGTGNLLSYEGIIKDITERKHAEESMQRVNRALKMLSAGNLALVRAKSEETLLKYVTNVIVKIGGYATAAVLYAQNDPEKTIVFQSYSGIEDKCCANLPLSWEDNEQGQLPMAKAIRTAATQVCRDIVRDPGFSPWRDTFLANGYLSNLALPLCENDQAFGVLSIYSSDKDSFDDEEITLLEELAGDLAYGILNLRSRAEHESHDALLRRSLEQSVQTIAATLEARDPYTAGHQRRVAELSTAIGREMGLGEEQIRGIGFAAIIHDLGKIHIPAEILSKPTRLTEIEYLLIKTHPQEGYNILREVAFPWPIADIILQHHERLDGTGYPNALRGDQILLEAKIIGVADMVEAMSSHRPYRAGLGIERALEEIKRNRGTGYDTAVVDACLALFEKGFAFSDDILAPQAFI